MATAPEDFRVDWAALVALLRAVGHVLKKVDAGRSTSLAKAVDVRWHLWGQHREANRIFWEFIEAERNNVLKAYDFGYAEEDVTIEEARDDGTAVRYANVPFFSPLRTGPFVGRPGLEIAREAIAWWGRELDAIEDAATEHGA